MKNESYIPFPKKEKIKGVIETPETETVREYKNRLEFEKIQPELLKLDSGAKTLEASDIVLLDQLTNSTDLELSKKSSQYLLKNLELLRNHKIDSCDVYHLYLMLNNLAGKED